MTRTARAQLSWKTIRKKFLYEGRTLRGDRAGKTSTAPQKTMRNNFVATKCFLKMSESEHSDSEFYFLGELSDAELLQLPTHNEAIERKSLISNQEIKKFR